MKLNIPQPYEPRPLTFPDDFVIVIDTREQKPLFKNVKGLVTITQKVTYGDYTIQGFEDNFGIERKRIGDFYAYIARERERTIKKLAELSTLDFAALVIESDYDDIIQHQLFTRVHPAVAEGFLTSVNVRYDIHTFFHKDRRVIERWILKRAIKFYDIKRGMA